jgi:hypothetical protein
MTVYVDRFRTAKTAVEARQSIVLESHRGNDALFDFPETAIAATRGSRENRARLCA